MILIALGANLDSPAGPPDATLRAALVELAELEISTLALSRIYRSPAWPDPSAPPYANAVAQIRTDLTAQRLMSLLHATETTFGRVRSARNAARTLDLDLIDCDGRVEDGPPTLPHPRLAERNFVLIPLRDVAPAWRHPASKIDIADLIAALPQAERALPLWRD